MKDMAKGFTLMELLVVLAIIGVTLGIGLPSYQTNMASSRLTSSANTMVTALSLARSEAIKQNKLAGVVFNVGGQSWDVVIFDSPNQVIQSYTAAKNVVLTVDSGDASVSYRPEGRLSTPTPIVMTFTTVDSNDYRKITIQTSGTQKLEKP